MGYLIVNIFIFIAGAFFNEHGLKMASTLLHYVKWYDTYKSDFNMYFNRMTNPCAAFTMSSQPLRRPDQLSLILLTCVG